MNAVKSELGAELEFDLVIVGAGPVGLMCAHLARLCGMSVAILDKSSGPLEVGRADALNARTLQLFEVAGLFDEIYPLGKPCNTSSVWKNGAFVSRQSKWWDEIEGCFHKHFLMIGQAHVERLLVAKLREAGVEVLRETSVEAIRILETGCETLVRVRLATATLKSRFVIGADGSRSFVRDHFKIPFEITRPQMIWAVLDGVIKTDFPKVPEIIAFQADTSDVAWIPREGELDRFYVRMDQKEFSQEDVLLKIRRAIHPHSISFERIEWFSQFSVKESVAEIYQVHDRVFLAGDACHIHSVNGGQGLNTGIADAFNLIWKLHANQLELLRTDPLELLRADQLELLRADQLELLRSYERERKPVALGVIETSAELVRATKFSIEGTHAEDYVKIVERRSGHITGMGIRYGTEGLAGTRLHDTRIMKDGVESRLYTLLDYSKHTRIVISDRSEELNHQDHGCLDQDVNLIRIFAHEVNGEWWTRDDRYLDKVVLVRPDSYLESVDDLKES